uniref:Substance-K receptor-like n=1 Tax=Hirondellea gigas TaxID=1518452 RepID=A0A2P2HW83_9CRUS
MGTSSTATFLLTGGDSHAVITHSPADPVARYDLTTSSPSAMIMQPLPWLALSLASITVNGSDFLPRNDSLHGSTSLEEREGNISLFADSSSSMGGKTCVFHHELLNMSSYEYDYRTETWREITWKEIFKILMYVVVFVVAVTGNLIVILVVYFNTNLWSSTNRYLVNLAIADLLVALCCTWVHLVRHLASPNYVLPGIVCRLDSFVQATTLSASVLTLTAISVGRFVAVMFPLRTHTSPDRAYRVILLIWITSALLASPMLLYRQLYSIQWANFQLWQCDEFWPMEGHYDEQLGHCVVTADHKKFFYTFFTIAIYFLPATIMLVSYSMVVWRLWASQLPGEHCPVSRQTVTRSKKKVVKMVTVVVAVFVICWTPLQSLILYSNFSADQAELPEWFASVEYASYFVAHANSAINPIIYCSFNSGLRRGFLALLYCRHNKRGSFYQRRTNWKGMTAGTRETTFGASGVDPAVLQTSLSIRRSNTRVVLHSSGGGAAHNSSSYRSRPQHELLVPVAPPAAADITIVAVADSHLKDECLTAPQAAAAAVHSSPRECRTKLQRNSSAYSVTSTGSNIRDTSSLCYCCRRKQHANSYNIYCSAAANDVVPDIAKAGGSCVNMYTLPPSKGECTVDGCSEGNTCQLGGCSLGNNKCQKIHIDSKCDSIDIPSGLSYEMITHGDRKMECENVIQNSGVDCEGNEEDVIKVEKAMLCPD